MWCDRTMKSRFFLSLFASCLLLAGRSAVAEDAQWTTLFNGKDLTGWVPVHDVSFKAVEGNLHLEKGMGWLRAEKEYKDFILELEFRALVEKYDSGIYFRSGLNGKPWPDGGWQVNLKYNQLGGLVKGYETKVPAEAEPVKLNQWTKMRLEVRGKKAVLLVNGEKSWETDIIDAPAGYLGIQAEDRAFDFRNIRIQELK